MNSPSLVWLATAGLLAAACRGPVNGPPGQPTMLTLAGTAGTCGYADGARGAAVFGLFGGLAVGPRGEAFVSDRAHVVVRRVTALGEVSRFAGIPVVDPASPCGSFPGTAADGPDGTATFADPAALAFDATGTLWVADGCLIRTVDAAGAVTTVAGTIDQDGQAVCGFTDHADPRQARFGGSGAGKGITIGPDGVVYVSEPLGHVIRRLEPGTLAVTTLAGQAERPGFADGDGGAARFNWPWGLSVGADGSLIVADLNNHRLRRVTPAGAVTTVAGTGQARLSDGPGVRADVASPVAVTHDAAGRLWFTDLTFLRRQDLDGAVVTVVDGYPGALQDGLLPLALVGIPLALAAGPDGSVYVADDDQKVIRKLVP